jgi:hypothetical protein
MRIQSITRLAALGAIVGGLACSKSLDTMAKPDEAAVKQDSTSQNTSGYKPMQRDTTLNGAADSARTRPDQGQPVTAKGDTLNTGVDSTNQAPSTPRVDSTREVPSGAAGVDTTGHMGNADTTGQMPADSAHQ